MQIDCDFPGGNIVVEKIDGDQAWLHQDLRDTEGDWFYWAFRVRPASAGAAQPRTLRFHFTGSNVIGNRGPAVSTDQGRTWTWLGRDRVQDQAFTYALPAGGVPGEIRFSMCLPYLESNLRAFLAALPPNPHLTVDTLCTDRAGRAVERLRLGCPAEKARHRLLITARHHCCETTPNFVIEGLIAAVLDTAPANAAGAWFRKNVAAWIIPFVDKDGVEQGDQGKNRKPHDHNRDYAPSANLFPSVKALCEQVPAWTAGQPFIDLDLHCPTLRGKWNEHIYFVGTPDPANWDRVTAFSRVLESVRTGPLPFNAETNLPFGQGWNNNANPELVTHSRWAGSLPGCRQTSTMEIPYANCGEITVTPAAARAFGRDLLTAFHAHW